MRLLYAVINASSMAVFEIFQNSNGAQGVWSQTKLKPRDQILTVIDLYHASFIVRF